jgi:hypothetical protein
MVLKDSFSAITFINSDEIFVEGFISKMKLFLKLISENKFYLVVLEPDPEKYFFYHFNKYPLIEISDLDEEDEYFSIIEEDPGDSPADAIQYNSNIILLYSDSLNWVIYVDRNYEVGIFGAKKSEVLEKFISSVDGQIMNSEEIIEEVFPVVFSNTKKGIPNNLIDNFRKNYSN